MGQKPIKSEPGLIKKVRGQLALARLAGFADAMTAEKEPEDSGEPVLGGAWELLLVPWYRLFDRDFKDALSLSDRAIAIDPGFRNDSGLSN